MSGWAYAVLLLAGIGAGITASAAGMSSLVSYPILLAVGLPPLSANVTNTVALVFSGAGAISGSREELTTQRRTVGPLIAASMIGGAAGSILLLAAPAASFTFAVPWLIAAASAAILIPRDSSGGAQTRTHRVSRFAGTVLIGIYGGYFGAAAGVLMLALTLATTAETLPRANAAKNVLCAAYNTVATITFALFGPVRWLAVVPLAAGFLLGGRLGPTIVRRLPDKPLLITIAAAGFVLAGILGWQAYHAHV